MRRRQFLKSSALLSLASFGGAFLGASSRALAWTATHARKATRLFVVLSTTGSKSLASRDGANWTQGTMPSGTTYTSYQTIGYSGSIYVLVNSVDSNSYMTSTNATTWTQRTFPESAAYAAIWWNGSLFCLVGGADFVLTSPDGINWTKRTLPVSGSWLSVMYGNSKWVIVGPSGALYSADAITWTQTTLANVTTTQDFQCIGASSTGTYVAVGYSRTATSTNGTTWTTSTTIPNAFYNGVAHNGSVFCAVNTNYAVASSDGLNWSGPYYMGLSSCVAICKHGTKFAVLDYYGEVAVSSDGITWTASTGAVSGACSIASNGSRLVVLQSSFTDQYVYTDDNGATWTAGTLPYQSGWNQVVWNGTIFCAVETLVGYYAVSSDGATWSGGTIPGTTGYHSLAWNGSIWTAIYKGYTGSTSAASSPNGTTWTARTMPSSKLWAGVASNGTNFAAIAQANFGTTLTGGLATSSNGTSWTGQTNPTYSAPGYWSAVTYGGSTFVAVANNSTNNSATSPDGVTWTLRTMPSMNSWASVGWNGTVFAVACNGTNAAASSPDGITWTARAIPLYVKSIMQAGTTLLATAWGSNNCLSSTTGTSWTTRAISVQPSYGAIYDGTNYIATFMSGIVKSSNLTAWTNSTISLNATTTNVDWQDVAWNGTRFCAVSSGAWATSKDGVTWQSQTVPFAYAYSPYIVWNGSKFCIVTTAGTATSADGLSWTTSTYAPNALDGLAWNGTLFCHSSNYGNAYSTDGLNWTTSTFTGIGGIAAKGTLFCSPLAGTQNFYTSTDGATWTARTVSVATAWSSIACNGAVFCAVSSASANVVVSKDGITWTASTLPSNSAWSKVFWNGQRFIAIGASNNIAISVDGLTWKASTLPVTGAWGAAG